jgi:catechol 2,3-dioxygenase-like lactoylglutathione lyase family enzyme
MLSNQKIIAFLLTADPERSKVFYQSTLGLRFIQDDGFALVFDANGTMLRITKAKTFTPLPSTVLGWEVSEIAGEAERLTDAGVVFEKYGFPGQDAQGIWTAPDGSRVAWFKDPDGNVLSLSQHA